MRLRNAGRILRYCLLGLAAVGLGLPAGAATVNIDFEADIATGTLHVGSDGVLSGAGTTWNAVESGVDASDLDDENGVGTTIDVTFTSAGGGGTDASATNDLQDTGTFRAHSIEGLDGGTTYDVAIYAAPFAFFAFTDASGTSGGGCTGTPTYALPGIEDSDYCLFLDRLPADLGGGNFGFSIGGLDGMITGMQVRAQAVTPPSVPALPVAGWLAIASALLATGARRAPPSLRAPSRGAMPLGRR